MLELFDGHYAYPAGAIALDGVSLSISCGESVALLGANGCGKSTLLHVLAGLVSLDRGRALAWGKPLSAASLDDDLFCFSLRRRIGFVFQDADAMLFCPNVYEEVAFGARQLGLAPAALSRRVADLLNLCSLESLAERAPYTLSGGEKRRVGIAAALACDPEVLLLDEPTTGLDPRSRDWLADMLGELHRMGKTIVLATHDLSLAAELTKTARILGEDHRLLASGSTTALLSDRRLLREANLISVRASVPFDPIDQLVAVATHGL